MHYLVWFGGHPNQLQRSPLHCPWYGIFKKVYHVVVIMHYLVWFGCQPNQLQRSPLRCPGSDIFKKVHHVNMHYFVLFRRSPKSAAEVTIALSLVWHFQKDISCRCKYELFGLVWGHSNQLQWSPLHYPWSCIFKKVYHVGVNKHCLV